MNDFELFLNFGAVVEIRRNYKDDLYNFVKLISNLGFMNNEITYFINTMGLLKELKNGNWEKIKIANNLALADKLQLLDEWFTDENFWHIIDINNGKLDRICIEYQIGKGFTFDKKENYLKYDETIKILSVEELIKACNQEDKFNLNYVETSFKKEMDYENNKELIDELDWFCLDFYDWELVKYSNGLYNILDTQTEELVGYFGNEENENGTLRDCIERVFYRMVDYYKDEEEHEDIEYVENRINTFIKLGKEYNLYNDNEIQWLKDWLKEEREFLAKDE